MYIKPFFLFIIILLTHTASFDLWAQTPIFNRLNVEQGLSQNSVLAVTQDKKGFIWLGTRHGLNRYDGYNFKTYQNMPGNLSPSSNNYVLALLCDSKNGLWVKLVDGSLYQYNEIKDCFEIVANRSKNVLVNCIYEDRQQNIWVGDYNGGLSRLTHRGKKLFEPIAVPGLDLRNSSIRCIYQSRNGLLWLGTTKGLIQLNIQNNEYHIYKHGSSATSLSGDYITSIVEDLQQNIWVATQDNGLNLFNAPAHTFTRLAVTGGNKAGLVSNKIRKMICDKTGRLWIGTQDGISILDPADHSFLNCRHDPGNKESLSQNSVHSLFEDASGYIWAGTFWGGVNFTNTNRTPFVTWQNNQSPTSLSNDVVSGIAEDAQHNLWVGTEGGGLNYFNRVAHSFSVYKNNLEDSTSLGSNLVKTVYLDKDQNLWVGTHGGGLNVLAKGSKAFRRYFMASNKESEIIALLEDTQKRFWVGGQMGLKLYTRDKTGLLPPTVDISLQAFHNKLVTSIFQDSGNNIWVGTNQGCFQLPNGGSQFKAYSKDYINCINQDGQGHIWVGLYYGGLAMYDEKNNRWIHYHTKDGLPNDNVAGILSESKDGLWVSTGNGLARFELGTKLFQNYTVSDGLAGNGFNTNSFFKDSKGEFFFGGYNGLTSFIPSTIEVNNHNAPIVLTGLKLFNDDVAIGGNDRLLKENISLLPQLTFRYNQNVFTIEYALLNYVKSDKNRYAYKLEGFDKEWNETSNTFATYTNLPSGSYTFCVKGANNDGIWGQPITIHLKVLPPFWLTWWAYCIYTLLLASILFFITRFFFLRALIRRENELHQVKLNFFTNISHEIRTHLTLIMAPVEKMLYIKDEQGLFRQQVEQIKSNSDRLLKLVSELMDFRKADTHHLKLQIGTYNLITFLQEILETYKELSSTKNIHVSFRHSTGHVPLHFDKEQLEKVFFNLLTNAFKFTPEGGHISMEVEETKENVIVKVRDNGNGIAPEYLKSLFVNYFQVADHGLQNTGYGIGLALTKNIIELHEGNVTVDSKQTTAERPGETCFTVTLPKGDTHFKNKGYVIKNKPADLAEATKNTAPTAFTPVTANINENITYAESTPTVMVAEDNRC